MDPTTFLSDFKDVKKKFFSNNLPAGIKSSVLYSFILQALFQSGQHLYEKMDGPGSGSLIKGSGS